MIIHLLRHGETTWNIERRWQGSEDSPLTPKGETQIQYLAKHFRHHRAEYIISSDLGRAAKTAQVIQAEQDLPLHYSPELRERSLGIFQGLTRQEIQQRYPDAFNAWQQDLAHYPIPEGESLSDFYQRCWQGLLGIYSQAAQQATKELLIVTHGGVIYSLLSQVLGIDIALTRPMAIPNTSINTLRYDQHESRWTVMQMGNIDHLISADGIESADDLI